MTNQLSPQELMEKADFTGWATKHDILCADGRTIQDSAFRHQDRERVPLVWRHQSREPDMVLGHAILEHRPEGVYTYAFFNDTPNGKVGKEMVRHGDVNALSIFAHKLVEKTKNVVHGFITEVSLVVKGANPGALIDHVNLAHSGELVELADDEAIIYSGEVFEHSIADTGEEVASTESATQPNSEVEDQTSSTEEATVEHADGDTPDDKTVQEVFDNFTDAEKLVVGYLIQEALDKGSSDDDDDSATHSYVTEETLAHAIQEGLNNMPRNLFDQSDVTATDTLSHEQLATIFEDAKRRGSLRESFLEHAAEYGFDQIDTLFPDAKLTGNVPEVISRRMEWVSEVLTGTKHSPFSRVRTVVADITADEARARGYVKGNLKKEEIVKLLKRKTEPTTIYKKQKLDRDDMLDITDLDVVAWLKAEMRLMLDEELARAILIGDGRDPSSDDKIDEDRLRPISKDDPMYAHPVTLEADSTVEATIDALIRARSEYRGSGQPTFFTTLSFLTTMLLHKDKMGRRIYDNIDALASALMVKKITPVEAMETEADIVGIFVHLNDYTVGSDKGGNVSMFDDFDIDYNQHKYLIETRVSGALNKPKSAVVVRGAAGTPVSTTSPSFDGATNTVTIPTVEGVEYTVNGIAVTGEIVIDKDTDVEARALPGYTLTEESTRHWNFAYNAG